MVKKIYDQFKLPIWILGGFVIFMMVLIIIANILGKEPTSDAPIVAISGENNKEYTITDEIKPEDFVMKATHEDGVETALAAEDIELSTTTPACHGKTMDVRVTLKESGVSCLVKVNLERHKVVGYQCGYPRPKDVVAVLYSNGELCFEGEGDTIIWDEGKFPWNNDTEVKDIPIRSVTFQPTVTPTNMNYWFEGCVELEYIDPIPKTVRTMVKTFSGCEKLENASDWSKAESLLNINSTYIGCKNLKNTYPIPGRVRIAKGTFENCESLRSGCDISNAKNLLNTIGMYRGCKMLVDVEVPENVTDMTEMFLGCINLKNMPRIPKEVRIMDSAFKGCLSLTSLQSIPKSVLSMQSTFESCEMISGEVAIDANPTDFSNMFNDAAIATKVNLVGESLLLDAFANTANSKNVFVDGYYPDETIKRYEDVFYDRD